ncbi:hypothetical protein ACOBR2_09205 [Telmatobacter bradus]|uniref:hypothetical protein n=1 Tax=Telmatobacter bradus TaxID=474953 RepID=UPI003B42830E
MRRFCLLLVMMLSFGSLFAAATDSSKVNGWISDSMCGAKHVGQSPKCAQECIQSMGAKPVFVDEAKKAVWNIDNPDAVKAFYGEHVVVAAILDEAKKSVHVESITVLK